MRLSKVKNRIINQKGFSYACLGALTLFACWFFVGQYGIFGAKVDWISQHSVFPDYFRQQFYETGELFPEFAGNIGGGQNIYNFSYYGLYSPVVLISYLLPFVKMSDYLMAAGVAGLLLSVWLFYYWLGKRGFSREIRFVSAVLFLFAGPMIYHSFHQVMFVNYMPFLCLSLLGVDRHFEKNKSGLYTMSVFLMIMTSFYFSIGGMLVLTLYGAARYLEQKERRWAIRQLFKDGICFLFPMFTAVLMSSVFLVPTVFAILGKREGTHVMDIGSLFIPDVKVLSLTYSSYGVGLTALIFSVLIAGLTYRKWHEKVLSLGCVLVFSIPVFTWLLNGGLYVRSKALIPFLPLLCYMTAIYLEKQKHREISFGINITAHVITLILLWCGYYSGQEAAGGFADGYLILADGILMLICFLIFRRFGHLSFIMLPPVVCLIFVFSMFYSNSKEMVDRETYARLTDPQIKKEIGRILDEEEGFYRLEQSGDEEEKAADLNRIWDSRQWISSVYSSAYNVDYQEFRKDIFGVEEPFRNDLMQSASDNPLYQKLMGVKYLVDGENVYENEAAAPVIYATDRVISENDFMSLSFPYDQIVLMRYAVAQDSESRGEAWKEEIKDMAHPVNLSMPESDKGNLAAEKTADGACHIQAKKTTSVTCTVEESGKEQERLFYMQFHVKNNQPDQDVAIWMEGIRNKLSADDHIYYNGNTTFTYVTVLEKGQTEVELTFGKGDYEISEIECFLGDVRILTDEGATENGKESGESLYQSVFCADWEQTKGSRILGKIQVKNTGYCVTSIPYDPNFEIFVDGKRTIGRKINTAFLGFSIAEGEHQVEIIYHAPGVKAGKLLSCFGFLMLAFLLLKQKFIFNRNI